MPAEPIAEASTKPPKVVTVIRRPDCSHGVSAVEKVRSLAQELGLGVVIDEILVLTVGDGEEHRCLGSPTILIRGQDVERAARGDTSYGLT